MYRLLLRVSVFCGLLGLAGAAHAATTVGGTTETQTWDLKGSPYIVTSAIVVPDKNTLTIAAGVEVLFDVNVIMRIEGRLIIEGTHQNPVIVRAADTNTEGWAGIVFLSAAPNQLSHARISGSTAPKARPDGGAVYINHADANVTMNNCRITGNLAGGNGGAIHVEAGTATLTRCLLGGNEAVGAGGAISVAGTGSVELIHCTLTGNTADGGGAVAGLLSTSGFAAVNTIFWSNDPNDILVPKESSATIAYCNIAAVPPNVGTAGTQVHSDPKFVAPKTGNFNLQSTSPCIDAGDPKSPLDPDGTRADIGAFFYNQAPSQALRLPTLTVDETASQVTVTVSGTIIDAWGVNFAFRFNPNLLSFESLD